MTTEITNNTQLKRHLHRVISSDIIRIIAAREHEFVKLLKHRRGGKGRNRHHGMAVALGMLPKRRKS